MANFGSFIKNHRESKGWTQTELGAKVGINSSAISRIENNTKQFSISKLDLLASIFEVESVKVKELFYADKFAREAFESGCPDTVFYIAVETVKYLKAKNSKQGQLKLV